VSRSARKIEAWGAARCEALQAPRASTRKPEAPSWVIANIPLTPQNESLIIFEFSCYKDRALIARQLIRAGSLSENSDESFDHQIIVRRTAAPLLVRGVYVFGARLVRTIKCR
jgi:hypothetical protein